MARNQNLRNARLLALLTPAALLGGAYISQYGFGLYPCEMCWWQRYPHFVALAFAAFAFARPAMRLPVALAALALLVSGVIGGFHAGVEYGWWEGFTTCTSNGPSGSDPLASIMGAPLVRCDVAPWSLIGISLAGWNFLISCAVAAVIFALLQKRGRLENRL